MRRSIAPLIPLVLLAVSCSENAPPAEAESAEPSPEASGTGPVTDWKSERKRLAMRGLAYDTGRAVPTDEARDVLAGLSVADVPRLVAEGRGQFETNYMLDAIGTFTRVALLEPDRASHYLDLGRALLFYKLEDQGIAALRTGLDLAPDDAELLFRVAEFEMRAGERDVALTRFARTVEIEPDHPGAWGFLARLHFYAKRDDAAWTAFHRAEDLGEPMPAAMRELLAARTPEPVR